MSWSDVLSVFLVQMFGPEQPVKSTCLRGHIPWTPTNGNEEPPF